MSVADYIAQYGKCARGTALLTSFDKLRSQKNISRNPTKLKVDSLRSNWKPTHAYLSRSFADPAYLVTFDHNRRWTSAIRQSCHFHHGNPLNAERLASSSTVDIRQHRHTGRPSSKDVLVIPVSTWRNRLQRLFETPAAAPAFLLVLETTPLVGHDNDWLKIISVVEPTYLGILPTSGKP